MHQIQDWTELATEARWSAAAMARNCGVSVRTLERHFLKEIGKRPKAWLAEQRQLQARVFLLKGFSVKETAQSLHYKHPNHLTSSFKSHWGHCPSKHHWNSVETV
jgi:transcriptional regulator GlxA family with amidase domain